MQIKYTLVRPDVSIEFFDMNLPGFADYIEDLRNAGFDYVNSYSEDLLTLTSLYTFTDARFAEYKEIIAEHDAAVVADRERREAYGIITTREIIQ